jgi:DNA polymerase I
MRKILVLDANNACWRLIKRLPELTANGQPVQVVYGFLRLLKSCIDQFEPDVALVCWDSGHSESRKKLYPEYKGNRDHNSDSEHAKEFASFLCQAQALKKLLVHLNVAQLEYPATEADDLMAIACEKLEGKKTIVSSDMGFLQLVSNDVDVWSPIKSELYTRQNFYKKMGLTPDQWLQLSAMVGRKMDMVEGAAKGFGEVTAKELLKQYGSVEKLFSPEVEKKVSRKGNRYSLLYGVDKETGETVKSRIFRNLVLMDLRYWVATNSSTPEIVKLLNKEMEGRSKVNRTEVREYFNRQKFKSILADFPKWITSFEMLDS